MATKIKKKSPNRSPYPDNSKERKIYEKGWRDAVNATDQKVEDVEVIGMKNCLLLNLYIFRSKRHATDEELKEYADDILQHAQWVREGKITYEMIKNELENVYDIEFGDEMKYLDGRKEKK